MIKTNKIDILSHKVMNLVSRYTKLKEVNIELENRIKKLEMEIEMTDDKYSDYENEKQEIKIRVERIIEKIEELDIGE